MAHRTRKRAIVVIIATIILLIIALAAHVPVVQAILGIALVLILPGSSITAAAFPRHALRTTERVLFSLGASLAVAIVGGFMLNLTPWGLQAGSWMVLFSGVTICASLIALLRQAPGSPVGDLPPGMEFSWGQGIQVAIAAVVVVAAVAVARLPAPQEGLQGYALLWALPADTADPQQIHLGISSREFSPTTYRLQVQTKDQVVQEWPAIRLEPGETWEQSIVAPADLHTSQHISVVLYRQDDPSRVYRQVSLR